MNRETTEYMKKVDMRKASPSIQDSYTITDLALHLGVHRNTVARMIRDREITATKIGRDWRITPEAVAEYKESRTVKASR